jgi:hypothetical protein
MNSSIRFSYFDVPGFVNFSLDASVTLLAEILSLQSKVIAKKPQSHKEE